MATVTGLTAERMLEIEAASIVDGDVVGDNLILTRHDSTQINAGSVRGPQGDAGPVGQDLEVISAVPVLDVGIANQIRAGRQLSATDFTNMGLSAPIGLWNLSDLSDASGNGRTLINKGSVPFGYGINGIWSTAAQFFGSLTQALYIADTGANDPFRIKTGSWGAWFCSTKKLVTQYIIAKFDHAETNLSWGLKIDAGGPIWGYASANGGGGTQISGVTDIIDDRWHFAVVTSDGALLYLYVDGVCEATLPFSGSLFGSPGPLNIGGYGADGSNSCLSPIFGRVDEAFVTGDVLTEDQVRNLYCAKISHALATTPVRVSLNVHRRRKGAVLVSGDFPTQPLRLYNFSGGSLADDGSNGQTVLNEAVPPAKSVVGADGSSGNAYSFTGSQALTATDTGLPAGTATRSYGCWVKTNGTASAITILSWGTITTGEARIDVVSSGIIRTVSNADAISGSFIADGQWHFVVGVEDNVPTDGVKRKLYVDGRLVGGSTVMNGITLGGANRFRIGANTDGTNPFVGQLDAVFVCGDALTAEQIRSLYAKGTQTLAPSPKNSGDHIEAMTSTDLLAVFDTLESQHQIDLAVA